MVNWVDVLLILLLFEYRLRYCQNSVVKRHSEAGTFNLELQQQISHDVTCVILLFEIISWTDLTRKVCWSVQYALRQCRIPWQNNSSCCKAESEPHLLLTPHWNILRYTSIISCAILHQNTLLCWGGLIILYSTSTSSTNPNRLWVFTWPRPCNCIIHHQCNNTNVKNWLYELHNKSYRPS